VGRRPRIFVGQPLVVTLFAVACHQSPSVPFARVLDQTASWAASVRFADEMRRAGNVPQAYVDDLLEDGAQEVEALQTKLSKSDDIAASIRSEAAELSGRLAASLRSSSGDARDPDAETLRAIEKRLRDLAQSVRTGTVARDGAGR